MNTEANEVVTKSEFARRIGRTKARVSQLVAAGLPVREDGRLDLSAALGWLEMNSDPARRPGAGTTGYADARAEHEALKADRTRILLGREQGLLIDRAAAEKAIFARARMERDAHQNWVVRVAPLLAARFGLDEREILHELEERLRQHLEALADLPLEIAE